MNNNISKLAIDFLRNEMNLVEFRKETNKVAYFETPYFHLIIEKNRKTRISIYTEGIAIELKNKYKLSKFLQKGENSHSNIKSNPSRLTINTDRCLFALYSIENLKNFIQDYNNLRHPQSFDKLVEDALKESSETRLKRIKENKTNLEKKIIEIIQYSRNPDIVAERLYLANGFCNDCGQPAPFLRKSNNTPYLEVHHIIPLSEGGEDTLENTIALCPNCHRKRHFG